MKKTLEKVVKECYKEKIHPHYCDKVYGSMDKICKYNGQIIQVPVYKDGHRGYAIRYECLRYKKA